MAQIEWPLFIPITAKSGQTCSREAQIWTVLDHIPEAIFLVNVRGTNSDPFSASPNGIEASQPPTLQSAAPSRGPLQFRLLAINQACAHLFELSDPAQVIGLDLQHALPTSIATPVQDLLRECAQLKQTHQGSVVNAQAAYQFHLAPIVSETGQVLQIIGRSISTLTRSDLVSYSQTSDRRSQAVFPASPWPEQPIHSVRDQDRSPLQAQIQQAEAEMRRSDTYLRGLFTLAAFGIVVMDITGRIIDSNPAFQDMLGYGSGELLTLTFTDITHPDDLQQEQAYYQELQAGRLNRFAVEKRYLRKEGEPFWAHLIVSLVWGDQGEPLFSFGMVEDITDRKRASEEQQQRHLQLQDQNRVLVELTCSKTLNHAELSSTLHEIVEVAVQTLQLDQATIWMYNLDRTDLHSVESYQRCTNAHIRHPNLSVQHYPIFVELLDQERTIAATDIHHDPRTQELITIWPESQLTRSILAAPIRLRGQTIGIICCLQEGSSRQWTVDEQTFAGSLADLVALALEAHERKQAEAALRSSQTMLRLVIDNIPQAVFWKDQSLSYIGCNQVAAIDAGLEDPEQILGKTDWDLAWPSQQAEMFQSSDREVFETQAPVYHRIMAVTQADGRQAWLDFNKIPLQNDADQVVGVLGTYEDITQRILTEQALREAEAKYRSIFENALEGIFQISLDGHYLTANPMLAQILGYNSATDLITSVQNIREQVYVDPQAWDDFTQIMVQEGQATGFESQVYRRDGHVIWISGSARPIYNAEATLLGYEGTIQDITQRKHAEEAIYRRDKLLQAVAKATSVLLVNTDLSWALEQALDLLGNSIAADHICIFQNQLYFETGKWQAIKHYEWVDPDLVNPDLSQELSIFSYSPRLERWYEAFQNGQSIGGHCETFPASEQEFLEGNQIRSLFITPIMVDQRLWGLMGVLNTESDHAWSAAEESILMVMASNIGGALQRQQAQDQMLHQALHDPLTQLPNRLLFTDRLKVALANAQRIQATLAVLFLDLDRFKAINDTLGHAVGDRVLQRVAVRLRAHLGDENTIARWGGDEFTLLIPYVGSLDNVAEVTESILVALKPPIRIGSDEFHITGSIGVAVYPQDGTDPETLLKHADAALHRAKDAGRGHYQVYTSALGISAAERLALDTSLHRALDRDEFILYYQPIFSLTTGRITRMEALIRWQHPEWGLVSPSRFIPVTEENGLVLPLGSWILRTACTQAASWQANGFGDLCVAVNLSARQFQRVDLPYQISEILSETGLSSAHLDLEITESLAMENASLSMDLLQELKHMGVQISMDDFGTGHSSLSYLKQFPLDAVKIDQSFVRTLSDPRDQAIIRTMVALGRGLNLKVIAEGVETYDQLTLLQQLECDEVQGYLMGRPLPFAEAELLLQNPLLLQEILDPKRDPNSF